MKPIRNTLFLTAAFFLMSLFSDAQTITNVQAKQQGDQVVITYYLQCTGTACISVYVSEDGGIHFTGPLKNVNGDVGCNITPGSKTITWNTLQERDLMAGNNIVFQVKGFEKYGTMTDPRDGKVYKTVTIGTQVWMQENLKTTHYNDGAPIQLVTDKSTWASMTSGAYCYYDNNTSYGNTYGALYNWYTVNTGKLCPTGWHVPTHAEWTILTEYLGGESVAGGKLKEAGTAHWQSPNTGATNESGFTALPGGYRSGNGSFVNVGGNGYWWSSTELNADNAWYRFVSYGSSSVRRGGDDKECGFSVRCVRD